MAAAAATIVPQTTSSLLRGIRHLLYGEGYTIRGVQRIIREQGVKFGAGGRAPRRQSETG